LTKGFAPGARKNSLFEGKHGTHPGHLTQPAALDQLHDQAIAAGVRVIYIDSLAVTAPNAEMDNGAASALMIGLIRIAQAIKGSDCVLHHSRKGMPGEGPEVSMDAARGASALMASVRIARQIVKVDGREPADVRFRIESAKSSNFAKPPDRLWGIKPILMNLDKQRSVPVMVTAVEVNPLDGVDDAKRQAAWDALIAVPLEDRHCDGRSPEWAGNVIGKALGLDTGDDRKNNNERDSHQLDNRTQCQAILDLWIRQGKLERRNIEIKRGGGAGRGASKRKIDFYAEGRNGTISHQLKSAQVE